MTNSDITITINGELRQVTQGLTLAGLLDLLQLRRPQVAVEVNRELVPREMHEQCRLAAGDRLEIVTLVGGG
jgi:sulfur carrier protein